MSYQIDGYMYDSATGDYPAGAKLTARYFNGLYAQHPYVVERGRIWVDVFGDSWRQCSVLQIDGLGPDGIAAMISEIPRWLSQRNQIGRGVLYTGRGLRDEQLGKVVAAAAGQPFDLWLSTLDGSLPAPKLPPNARMVAIQAWGAPQEGHHADRSAIVNADFWLRHALR